MKTINSKSSHKRRRGMTLPEVLIAASIGVGVVGASTWFLIEGARMSYASMAEIENGIQQWGLNTKLQIDAKIANGADIFLGADPAVAADYLQPIPVDDNINTGANGLERGKVLVLSKTVLDQGRDTGVISDLVFYLYTPGYAPNWGTLKRYPAKAPATFQVAPADAVHVVSGVTVSKTVRELVDENIALFTSGAQLVQDHVTTVSGAVGPFASFGDGNHVSIALVREETVNNTARSNLSEVSFNLR